MAIPVRWVALAVLASVVFAGCASSPSRDRDGADDAFIDLDDGDRLRTPGQPDPYVGPAVDPTGDEAIVRTTLREDDAIRLPATPTPMVAELRVERPVHLTGWRTGDGGNGEGGALVATLLYPSDDAAKSFAECQRMPAAWLPLLRSGGTMDLYVALEPGNYTLVTAAEWETEVILTTGSTDAPAREVNATAASWKATWVRPGEFLASEPRPATVAYEQPIGGEGAVVVLARFVIHPVVGVGDAVLEQRVEGCAEDVVSEVLNRTSVVGSVFQLPILGVVAGAGPWTWSGGASIEYGSWQSPPPLVAPYGATAVVFAAS